MIQRRNKIFYYPVLYSIFSVAVTILVIMWPVLSKKHIGWIEVNWYKEGVSWGPVPRRQFLVVTFTGDNITDSLKLDFGQNFIREMLANKDTVHAIDFHFGEKSRYATFVAVLDICKIEDARYFVASDDGIKVFYYSVSRFQNPNIIPINL